MTRRLSITTDSYELNSPNICQNKRNIITIYAVSLIKFAFVSLFL